ncbi:MAG: hypothetical protein AAF721_28470 [Myxococcota bacterium]
MRWGYRVAGALALGAGYTACLDATFVCDAQRDCVLDGVAGICVDGGCALPDGDCPSGHRFHSSASGGRAGDCVAPTSAEDTGGDEGTATTQSDDAFSDGMAETTGTAGAVDTGSEDASDGLACAEPPCGCVTAIAAGVSQNCVLRADASIVCWGDNDDGEVGTGAVSDSELVPTVVPLAGDRGGVLLAAHRASCAIDEDGTPQCWGRNTSGQADPSTPDDPVLVPAEIDLPVPMAWLGVGPQHACAANSMGTVACWGNNEYGELGVAAPNPPGPVEVDGLPNSAAALGVGVDHSCVLADGQVWCWGRNQYGQLGVGTMPAQSETPMMVPTSAPVRLLGVGENHACAVLQGPDVAIECWGRNDRSQTGAPPSEFEAGIQSVDTSGVDGPIARLRVYHERNCILTEMGSLYCWGHASNATYQTSGYTYGDPEPLPQRIDAAEEAGIVPIDFDHGSNHMCVVSDRRTVHCWGDADSGALADAGSVSGPDMGEVVIACP